MGDSITEGTVVAFLKQPGEYAALDEVVVQIETDKVASTEMLERATVIDLGCDLHGVIPVLVLAGHRRRHGAHGWHGNILPLC